LSDEAASLQLGADLAQCLAPGLVIYLVGDLGAGKTTLVRGLLRGLGFGGNVKSPTYTLVELYAIFNLRLYHFDFYRFESPEEYLDAGLDEYFGSGAVCLVEWPERAAPYLPPSDLRVYLRLQPPARVAELKATTGAGRACIEKLRALRQAR
jgi:tRNA threonylcarbamoyladenosine biosynthesis protein TsaE